MASPSASGSSSGSEINRTDAMPKRAIMLPPDNEAVTSPSLWKPQRRRRSKAKPHYTPPLLSAGRGSEEREEEIPFSPTHSSPSTEKNPTSSIMSQSTPSQSLLEPFSNMGLPLGIEGRYAAPLPSSPFTAMTSTERQQDFFYRFSSVNEFQPDQRPIARSPSPKIPLPSIQTTFHARPEQDRVHALSSTSTSALSASWMDSPADSTRHSRADHSLVSTPSTTQQGRQDSDLASTIQTTPSSSIAMHYPYEHGPVKLFSETLSRSPVATSSHVHHSVPKMGWSEDDRQNKLIPDIDVGDADAAPHLLQPRSSFRGWQSDWSGICAAKRKSMLTAITPLMLLERLGLTSSSQTSPLYLKSSSSSNSSRSSSAATMAPPSQPLSIEAVTGNPKHLRSSSDFPWSGQGCQGVKAEAEGQAALVRKPGEILDAQDERPAPKEGLATATARLVVPKTTSQATLREDDLKGEQQVASLLSSTSIIISDDDRSADHWQTSAIEETSRSPSEIGASNRRKTSETESTYTVASLEHQARLDRQEEVIASALYLPSREGASVVSVAAEGEYLLESPDKSRLRKSIKEASRTNPFPALYSATPSSSVGIGPAEISERGLDRKQEESRPLQLLYVTSGQETISNHLATFLIEIGAIHLDIPIELVQRHRQGRGSCQDFSSLDKFVVGAMSKRRFSSSAMEHPLSSLLGLQDVGNEDARASKISRQADVVLIGSLRRSEGWDTSSVAAADETTSLESSDEIRHLSSPFTPDVDFPAPAAVQVLASAVVELQQQFSAEPSNIFNVQGGIRALQASFEQEQLYDVTKMPTNGASLDLPLHHALGPARDMETLQKAPFASKVASLTHIGMPVQPVAVAHSSLPGLAPRPSEPQKPARPNLARLDTSEKVQKVGRGPSPAVSVRGASDKSPRLSLNTHFSSQPATMQGSRIGSPVTTSPLQVRELRRESEPGGGTMEDRVVSTIAKAIQSPQSPARSFSLSTGEAANASFEPSEILSDFLFLGPDITTSSEVQYLRQRWGIRRILNAASEIEMGGGKHLNLDREDVSGIEKYKKLPLKDVVEARGVQKYMDEACAFLDDARLHSAPVYVHCKAGKSRSVMLVMAYLIHANRWSLQRSYAYVVERRRAVSPNIGFVAELMAFEARKLGLQVRTEPSSIEEGDENAEHNDVKDETSIPKAKKTNRESLPTTNDEFRTNAKVFWQSFATTDPDPDTGIEPKSAAVTPFTMDQATATSHTSANRSGVENKRAIALLTSSEYKGPDGRYHVKRPPADERFLAPVRRATLAAIDSENDFGRRRTLHDH